MGIGPISRKSARLEVIFLLVVGLIVVAFGLWGFVSFLAIDKLHHGHTHHFDIARNFGRGLKLRVDLIIDFLTLSCRLLRLQKITPSISKLILVNVRGCLGYSLFI